MSERVEPERLDEIEVPARPRLTVDDFVRTCAVDDAAPAAMIAQTIAAIRAGLASHACGGADLAMSDREA